MLANHKTFLLQNFSHVLTVDHMTVAKGGRADAFM